MPMEIEWLVKEQDVSKLWTNANIFAHGFRATTDLKRGPCVKWELARGSVSLPSLSLSLSSGPPNPQAGRLRKHPQPSAKFWLAFLPYVRTCPSLFALHWQPLISYFPFLPWWAVISVQRPFILPRFDTVVTNGQDERTSTAWLVVMGKRSCVSN